MKGAACAQVKAGNLIEISTRCFGDSDHLCGNDIILSAAY